MAYETLDDDWLVVLDRKKTEPYSVDRDRKRWRVEHVSTLATNDYGTKDEARIAALKSSQSPHDFDQWWKYKTQ
jgi:hypothetical protein